MARLQPRQRRYLPRRKLVLLAPAFTYNQARDAYVLRGVGTKVGPVLREDRRVRRIRPAEGVERRGASLA